jgi:hypothetical protein
VTEPHSPDEVDWDKAMDLLRHHQRGLTGRPVDNRMPPTRVATEALTAKLVRKLKAVRDRGRGGSGRRGRPGGGMSRGRRRARSGEGAEDAAARRLRR